MTVLITIAIGLLFIAIALLFAQAFKNTSADNRIYRADKDFYKFEGARPFTNEIYIRQLQKYNLVDTQKYYEEFEYTGKTAINGSKKSHFFKSNRKPMKKSATPDLSNVIQPSIETKKKAKAVSSIQRDDPLLKLD